MTEVSYGNKTISSEPLPTNVTEAFALAKTGLRGNKLFAKVGQ